MKKEKTVELLKDIGADILGSAIFAVGVNTFTTPNEIAPGGVTGIATMLHSITQAQMGTLTFLLNIPLIILGLVVIGKRFTINTFRTLFILSVITNITEAFLPVYTENALLAALFGGSAIGIGMGIIFLRGSTTGGTDILGRVLLRYFQHIPLGKILLAIDFVIVTAAGIYYGTLDAALYALVSVYVTERAMDSVLYGFNETRIAYVVTEHPIEVAQRVMDETDRGVTYLNGEGGYQRDKKLVIMCAMPSRQFAKFKRIVLEVDHAAFIMVAPASNVIGEGFKETFDE
ncbi:MAG: YitT family protein [Oscillospiraceae bacterium]|nr:YitT family protein [Oscillospiraceae bacterium]MBQ3236117.1 YitT family protein [Oscillospiraceae bacterium]